MERELSLVTIQYVGVIECPCGRNVPVRYEQMQAVIRCPVCSRGYTIKPEAVEAIPPSKEYVTAMVSKEFPGLLHEDNHHSRCPDCKQMAYRQDNADTGFVVWFCWRCGITTGHKLKP